MTDQSKKVIASLNEGGYRLTPARRAIIGALVDSDGHITADELAALVHQSAPRVGRMTVYRTLDVLCDLGLVRPVFLGTGAAHYVLLDGGSHHHFICNNCRRVFDFDQCRESAVAHDLGRQFNFQVQSHLLEVYGLCEPCQSAADKERIRESIND